MLLYTTFPKGLFVTQVSIRPKKDNVSNSLGDYTGDHNIHMFYFEILTRLLSIKYVLGPTPVLTTLYFLGEQSHREVSCVNPFSTGSRTPYTRLK